MSVGLVWKSAAKSNEKLANQKYETMLLSWMPTKIINEKKKKIIIIIFGQILKLLPLCVGFTS